MKTINKIATMFVLNFGICLAVDSLISNKLIAFALMFVGCALVGIHIRDLAKFFKIDDIIQ